MRIKNKLYIATSDAGEGTTKEWPTGRGDLNFQRICIQGSTMAAGRVERGTLLLGNTVRIVPSVSSTRIFTLFISRELHKLH